MEKTKVYEKQPLTPLGNRLMELDYVKAFCILAMILVHCYEEFYDGGGSASTTLFVDIFNVVIGASAFMFCMGFTSNMSNKVLPKYQIIRGAGILVIGYVLNIVREPIVGLITLRSSDWATYFRGFIYVFAVDILQFAGLGFILLGVLRLLKIKSWGIFIISLALSGIGTLLRFTDVGNPLANQILGLFIGTISESYFPLLHWFVFIAAGNLYKEYYTKIEDKKKYYRIALPVSAALTAAYLLLAAFQVMPFETLSGELTGYVWMNPCDAVGCVCCVIFYLGVMWLLSELIKKLKIKRHPLVYLSKNINTLYCIHWVLVMIIELFIFQEFELLPWPETDIAIIGYAVFILFATIGICEFYKKFIREKLHAFLKKQPLLWVGIVLAIVIASGILTTSNGLTEVPSFFNDYEVEGIEL